MQENAAHAYLGQLCNMMMDVIENKTVKSIVIFLRGIWILAVQQMHSFLCYPLLHSTPYSVIEAFDIMMDLF